MSAICHGPIQFSDFLSQYSIKYVEHLLKRTSVSVCLLQISPQSFFSPSILALKKHYPDRLTLFTKHLSEYKESSLTSLEKQDSTFLSGNHPLSFNHREKDHATVSLMNAHGQWVHPSLYIQEISTMNPKGMFSQTFFEGEEVSTTQTKLVPTERNEYQGRVQCELEPFIEWILPGLPNAEVLAIKPLPPDVLLLKDKLTGRYALWTQKRTAPFIFEWRIRADFPQTVSDSSTDFSFLESIEFQKNSTGEVVLKSPIEWPSGLSEPEKARILAAWFSGFVGEDASGNPSIPNEEKLNLIVKGRKGRCSERAAAFCAIAREALKELEVYYTSNELHAMALVKNLSTNRFECFNLGGLPGNPRLESLPSPETSSSRPTTRPLFTQLERLILRNQSFLDDRHLSRAYRTILTDLSRQLAKTKSNDFERVARLFCQFERYLLFTPRGFCIFPTRVFSGICFLNKRFIRDWCSTFRREWEEKEGPPFPHSQEALMGLPHIPGFLTAKEARELMHKQSPIGKLKSRTSEASSAKSPALSEALEDPLVVTPPVAKVFFNPLLPTDIPAPIDISVFLGALSNESAKLLSLHPEGWILHPHKPKNICVTVKNPAERAALVEHWQFQEGIFIAESLRSLRHTVYELQGDMLSRVDSPVWRFLQSDIPSKTLVISGEILLKTSGGASDYYPLLDPTRCIHDLKLEPDVLLVIILTETEWSKAVREDFHSRMQLYGPLIEPVPVSEGVSESKSELPDASPIRPFKVFRFETETDLPHSTFRITPYTFPQLMPFLDITTTGVRMMPGVLDQTDPPTFAIIQDLTERQWRQLSELSSKTPGIFVQNKIHHSFLLPQKLEAPELRDEPIFRVIPVTYADIPGHIPSGAISLSIPELGNPFFLTQSSEEGDILGRFTDLKTHLERPHQTLVLYGKLPDALFSQWINMNSGEFYMGGEQIRIGEGTRLIVLDRQSSQAPSPSEGRTNAFCRVIEGPVEVSSLPRLAERIEEWMARKSSHLLISSFDLFHPKTRLQARDLVNSALSGYVMIDGKLIGLEGLTVELRGPGIPKKIKKMALSFGAYEEHPRVEPTPLHASARGLEMDPVAVDTLSQKGLILTRSRIDFLRAAIDFLETSNPHQPLFLVEGPSGIGKTVFLKHYLEARYGEKFEVLLPSEDLVTRLEEANRTGKVVLIDELNTLPKDQLEAISILLRSCPNLRLFGTQNSISFAGRSKLDSDLLKAANVYFLEPYDREELTQICEAFHVPKECIPPMLVEVERRFSRHQLTFRDFIAAMKSMDWTSGTHVSGDTETPET
jgi:hypothetical protein